MQDFFSGSEKVESRAVNCMDQEKVMTFINAVGEKERNLGSIRTTSFNKLLDKYFIEIGSKNATQRHKE